MTDTMPSGESQSDPDEESGASDSGADTHEPAPEEERDDADDATAGVPGDTDADTDDDDGEEGDQASGGPDAAGTSSDDQAGGEPEPDPELAKVAGSNPPDPKKLDQLDEQIRHARTTAEEVVGTEEQPIYTESGDQEPEDDQAITPPG